MTDLRDLYQEVIIDHSKHPRNFHVLKTANRKGEGYNPLCGDKLTLYLELEGNLIKNISFEGSGCAISTASVSMLTETLKGKTVEEASHLFEEFHQMVTGNKNSSNSEQGHLDKLVIFEGVKQFPSRIKCATLCWHTLKAALEKQKSEVSTEEE